MPELLLRRAEKKDLPEIQKLLSTYFLDMEGLEYEAFLLAEKQGRILGCAALIQSNSGELEFLELHTIAVHPNHRGKGIGKKLVNAFCSELSKGLNIYVRTTAPRFFEKIGFENLPANIKTKLWADCANCEHFKNCGQTLLKYKNTGN